MAQQTPKPYRNLVLYEVYVRNHGRDGNLANVTHDLPRLKEMGVDVVWFMPIHPIGQLNKKGELGCPYSIQDYRTVNPEYGTKKEFEVLCQYAHALGLKVMIDVVYNHTSHDAMLLTEHPEWYHQDENGRPITTVPAWSDVIDLDYSNEALWDYQIETLQMWAKLGVDGFRCDVASIVPLDFWKRARTAVAQVKPGVIWLAESVHTSFGVDRRRHGLTAHSDGEIHEAFDLSYDYDIWPTWEKAVADPAALPLYVSLLWQQKGIYPAHTIKMRCVENHDQPRIMALAPSRPQALAWTAFQAFNRGAFLIYAGQESAATHTPSLFDIDKVAWGRYELQPFLATLARLKKHAALVAGQFVVTAAEPAIQAGWTSAGEGLYGVFNVAAATGDVAVPLPDGEYGDLLNGRPVEVRGGRLALPEVATILHHTAALRLRPLSSELLD